MPDHVDEKRIAEIRFKANPENDSLMLINSLAIYHTYRYDVRYLLDALDAANEELTSLRTAIACRPNDSTLHHELDERWQDFVQCHTKQLHELQAANARIAELDNAKSIAESLWKLLDDIDTVDDACKNNEAAYRARVRKCVHQRFEHIDSDGYVLIWKKPRHDPCWKERKD